MIRIIRLAWLAFLIPVASAVSAADLLDIYRAAQTADAQYAAARAAWAAGQEKLPQGRAGLLPSLTASGSTQWNDRDIRFRDPLSGAGGPSQFNSSALTLSLTQPIFRWQNLVAFEQAKIQVAQSDAVFAQAAQDLILRVAQAYFDVLLAEFNVELAAAQKKAFAEQLAQAKRNFEVGTATITDTHEAQARFDLSVSQEIAAQNELEIKKRALQQVIARPAPALAPVSPARFKLVKPDPDNIDAWVTDSQQSNLQVQIAQAGLDFASQEVGRNRGGHYPTLDAFATYSETGSGAGTSTNIGGSDTTSKIVGLQLSVPLYQGGSVNSRVREALANADKARQELENARRSAELATRQAFLGVTSGGAQVSALQAAVVSSQSSLDSTRLGLEVGVRTQVDVLNATQQLFSTRRDQAQAVYNYLLSLLRLKAAVGRLAEEDLGQINQWLDKK